MNHLEYKKPKRSAWYWYVLVILLSLIAANTVGAVPYILALTISVVKNGSLDFEAVGRLDFQALGFDLNVGFACILFIFAVFLIAAILFIKLFHGSSWKEIINGTNRVRWSRFFFGFFAYGAILLVLSLIGYFAEPEKLQFQFKPDKFFVLLFLAVIFIPLQATAEEFTCRGYIAQGIASWTKSRWWAFLIPRLLFGLLHAANPEIEEFGFGIMITTYIVTGLVLGFMSVMDDGIELAMGVHAVNNLVGVLLVTYKGSALPVYALFEQTEIDPAGMLFSAIISGITILAVFAYKYKWNLKIINQKVERRD